MGALTSSYFLQSHMKEYIIKCRCQTITLVMECLIISLNIYVKYINIGDIELNGDIVHMSGNSVNLRHYYS